MRSRLHAQAHLHPQHHDRAAPEMGCYPSQRERSRSASAERMPSLKTGGRRGQGRQPPEAVARSASLEAGRTQVYENTVAPRRRIPLASVADGLAIGSKARSGSTYLHQLDTSHGCQNHTLLPSAASSSHTPRPARMLPEGVSTEAFKRRSSARCARSRKNRPATTLARPTLPRPPQPVPTFVTMGQRPSSRDRIAGVVGLIWVTR